MPTLFEKLIAANLPIISANESGEISTREMTQDQQQIFNMIILEHFKPEQYAGLQDFRINKQQLQTEFQTTIDQLLSIENTINPTNAQVIAAVKFLAKTLRLLLKLIAQML